MSDHFDIFVYDGQSCYFCGGDVPHGRTLCHLCALNHSEREVAAKRFIASILRENKRSNDQ